MKTTNVIYHENVLNIYLDTNIISEIEKGNSSTSEIIKGLGIDHGHFHYSLAHIYETDNLTNYKSLSKKELVKKRLTLISQISEDAFICQLADKKLYLDIKSPFDIYESIKGTPVYANVKQKITDVNPFIARRFFRNLLKLDSKELNNLRVGELINFLNSKYTEAGLSENFTDTIISCFEEICGTAKLSLYDQVAIIFAALDNVGFWKDKETETSDAARMWNANHCYYAAYSDLLITNDRRLRKKAEVTFALLNVTTRIIRLDELDIIKEDQINYNPLHKTETVDFM